MRVSTLGWKEVMRGSWEICKGRNYMFKTVFTILS